MSYLPDKCIWEDLDDTTTRSVMKDFDLDTMNEPYARVNFNDNNCKIQICNNVKLNEKPMYMLKCNPTYGYGNGKINKLLLKEDQRESLSQLNPYSKSYRSASPASVTEITAGTRRTKQRKTQRKKQRKTRKHENKNKNKNKGNDDMIKK